MLLKREGNYKTNKNHFAFFKLIFPFFDLKKNLNRLKSSACVGDSGGPMHKTKNGRTTIIGLTSGTEASVFKDPLYVLCIGPTYFTRVGYYLKWIEETIGGQEEHC